MNDSLDQLQARLAYTFRDAALLERALTHPSFLPEHPGTESNQRLEFLGDAVLQLVLTETLFRLYPADREGLLSRRRAALANGPFLEQSDETQRGMSIFACDLETAARLSDEDPSVRAGRLDELRHLMRTTVKVRTRAPIDALRTAPYIHEFSTDDGLHTFSVDRTDLDRTMTELTTLGIEELTVTPASLEDLFLREYQEVPR